MLADILICLVLIAIVTSIVHSLIKNKKQGKSLCSASCTGNCAHCGGHCSHKSEKRPSKDGRFSWTIVRWLGSFAPRHEVLLVAVPKVPKKTA